MSIYRHIYHSISYSMVCWCPHVAGNESRRIGPILQPGAASPKALYTERERERQAAIQPQLKHFQNDDDASSAISLPRPPAAQHHDRHSDTQRLPYTTGPMIVMPDPPMLLSISLSPCDQRSNISVSRSVYGPSAPPPSHHSLRVNAERGISVSDVLEDTYGVQP